MSKSKNQDTQKVCVSKKLEKSTKKRRKSNQVADSLERLGYEKKADRVRNCSTEMVFAYIFAEDRYQLHHANFCRERLCPMCAWHRTQQIFAQVSQVMDTIEQERPELVPIFLTLTVRNCSAAELNGTLDIVFKGWNNMMSGNSKVNRLVAGWFRALEITYNEQEDTYHPHIHAILLMPPSYFTTPKDYMTTEKWAQTWRKAMKLDYDPICDIRRVETEEGKAGAVAEVAKYTVKDSDYLKDDEKLTDKLVSEFGKAIKGRRLVAFGGLMKDVAKRLKLNLDRLTPDEVTDEKGVVLRKDVDYILVLYRWNVGLSRYDYEGQISG